LHIPTRSRDGDTVGAYAPGRAGDGLKDSLGDASGIRKKQAQTVSKTITTPVTDETTRRLCISLPEE
jgi:hypothetical protein